MEYQQAAAREEIENLKTFQKRISNNKAQFNPKHYVYNHDAYVLTIASFVIMGLCAFWLFYDLFKNGSFFAYGPLPFIGLVLMILASIALLFINFKNDSKNIPVIRNYFLIYHLVVIFGVMCVTVGHNKETAAALADFDIDKIYNYIGVPLVSFLLVILALTPLPRLFDNIITLIAVVAACIIPAFIPGKEAYPLLPAIIITLGMILVYIVFYRILVTTSQSQGSTSSIAYIDSLTGTLNRRALDHYWECAAQDNDITCMGAIMFDIDDFKKYNDTYSHPKGDEVLAKVCSLVSKNLDKDQHLFFRYGGEEFIILLPNTSLEYVIAHANAIRSSIEEENIERDDGGRFPYITITQGCAMVEKSDDYIALVDKQLYIGKAGPKNCVVANDRIIEG